MSAKSLLVLGHETMNENKVKAWLIARDLDVEGDEYEKYAWAVDSLYEQAYNDPDKLLKSVIEILEDDSSTKTLGALGSGPLEEFLVHHGEKYMDEVERIVKIHPAVGSCLRFTFVDADDLSEPIRTRLSRLTQV